MFFSTWFVLAQVDWMSVLEVQKTTDKTEEKLGELYLELFKKTGAEIDNPFVNHAIDSIVNTICRDNYIDRESIKVHLLRSDEINAFALPNGHLLIYSGLILAADNQDQLGGVICHEIAHIQLNHVMKKLVKEVGLSALVSMTMGKGGAEIMKETAKLLSSSAFDRSLEKEADIKAIDYLINAKINPEPFANFLYKLSDNEFAAMKYQSWISTHPDSKQRAGYIIDNIKNQPTKYEPVLTAGTWIKLRDILSQP
ncbi:Peptidase family M48 [Saccharicrinis carchari]|uniref:Peptidase family M48 n=1 Tax=Saccharicrinis carchari TaxID=1168039 RepID=A0A521CQW7_SACCC|nr:Peptidase family M48 [Saccharicrinis carchari]